MTLYPAEGVLVDEDVEEAQELSVDVTRGAHHAWLQAVGDTLPHVEGLPVAMHLFVCLSVGFIKTFLCILASRSLSGWACQSVPLSLTVVAIELVDCMYS